MTTETKDEQTGSTGEEKLYAGKFKTIEELESGYKNAAGVYNENETLKKKVEDLSNVPIDYINPSDVELEEARITDIKTRAKEAGLTQAQYEKFVRSDKARVEQHKLNFENAKKEVGEETMNILKDYVSKNYPKEIQDNMLNTFIGNKGARQAALSHRDQILSNRVPGMDKQAAPGYTVTKSDVEKAYQAKEKNNSDIKARDHYLNILGAYSAQQQAS